MNPDPNIKFEEHYKLCLPFRDKILFEASLENDGIPFYYEENQPNINVSVKYYLRDVDSAKIDTIVIRNGFAASTETIHVNDFREEQKIQKLYLKVAAVVILIILGVSAIIALTE